MDYSLDLAVDRFFEYPFYQAEYYSRAVERGNRQQIEHRQIYAYKRRYFQREKRSVTYKLTCRLYRGYRSADGVYPDFTRQKFAETSEYRARYLERIDERMPYRSEKSEPCESRCNVILFSAEIDAEIIFDFAQRRLFDFAPIFAKHDFYRFGSVFTRNEKVNRISDVLVFKRVQYLIRIVYERCVFIIVFAAYFEKVNRRREKLMTVRGSRAYGHGRPEPERGVSLIDFGHIFALHVRAQNDGFFNRFFAYLAVFSDGGFNYDFIAFFAVIERGYKVGSHIYARLFAVFGYRQNIIAVFDRIRIFDGVVIVDVLRADNLLTVNSESQHYNQQREDIVHRRACKQHQNSLPRFLFIERIFVRTVAVFTFKRAKSAERQQPYGKILAAFEFLFEYRRTHADGEFVDFEFENLTHEVMPRLVNGYHYQQYKHGYQNIADVFHYRLKT